MKKHPGILPYKCNECHFQGRTVGMLNHHKLTHSKEKTIVCTSCSFTATNTTALSQHVNQFHLSSETETSEISETPSHDTSDPHCVLNTSSPNEAKFMCDLCGSKYQSSIWLKQHKRQHLDPRKYSSLCAHCDEKYENRAALKAHLNRITGEKPFLCRLCESESTIDDSAETANSASTSTLGLSDSAQPRLRVSNYGKIQLIDQGYSFCVNKTQKNNRTYFRCTHGKGPTQCKASAMAVGPLQEGKFKLEYHHVEKHLHEPCAIGNLVKDFNNRFKSACVEQFDRPVTKVHGDLMREFTAHFSSSDKAMFHSKLPSFNAQLNVGYRARGCNSRASELQ